ncbi:MAG: DUF1028 domain-containing protein [Chloroflexi bacterium]|nr:DUF1028 domain-containing protein [Chloroflexota bacterium]
MTYTILARSPDGRQTGIGIATVSFGVGGACPYVAADGTVIVSQAFTWPRLGVRAVKLVEAGTALPDIISQLEAGDPSFAYRQMGIMRPNGEWIVHTGASNTAFAGHCVGIDCVALGNIVAHAGVLHAMVETYEDTSGDMAGHILGALEAGRDAGGQTRDGRHLAERSAYIRVVYGDDLSDLDLRVDVHAEAIAEMRRQLAIYRPYVELRRLIARDPVNRPDSVAWEREHLTATAPPQYAD